MTTEITVMGDVRVMEGAVVLGNERIDNDTPDTLVMNGQDRSVIRDPSRDELYPHRPTAQRDKARRKELER